MTYSNEPRQFNPYEHDVKPYDGKDLNSYVKTIYVVDVLKMKCYECEVHKKEWINDGDFIIEDKIADYNSSIPIEYVSVMESSSRGWAYTLGGYNEYLHEDSRKIMNQNAFYVLKQIERQYDVRQMMFQFSLMQLDYNIR